VDEYEKIKEYLEHHGVLGMKWGIRKSASERKINKLASSRKLSKKKLSKLCDEDIKRVLARKTLLNQTKTDSKLKKLAENYISKVENITISQLAGKSSGYILKEIEKLITK